MSFNCLFFLCQITFDFFHSPFLLSLFFSFLLPLSPTLSEHPLRKVEGLLKDPSLGFISMKWYWQVLVFEGFVCMAAHHKRNLAFPLLLNYPFFSGLPMCKLFMPGMFSS